MEIKKNAIYGKKQQTTLDERCEKTLQKSSAELESLLRYVLSIAEDLHKEIRESDMEFEHERKEAVVNGIVSTLL